MKLDWLLSAEFLPLRFRLLWLALEVCDGSYLFKKLALARERRDTAIMSARDTAEHKPELLDAAASGVGLVALNASIFLV